MHASFLLVNRIFINAAGLRQMDIGYEQATA